MELASRRRSSRISDLETSSRVNQFPSSNGFGFDPVIRTSVQGPFPLDSLQQKASPTDIFLGCLFFGFFISGRDSTKSGDGRQGENPEIRKSRDIRNC